MSFIGELAGLLTSIAWSGTSVLFTKATQQVGSLIANRMRVILALLFLVILNWVFYGYCCPSVYGLYGSGDPEGATLWQGLKQVVQAIPSRPYGLYGSGDLEGATLWQGLKQVVQALPRRPYAPTVCLYGEKVGATWDLYGYMILNGERSPSPE